MSGARNGDADRWTCRRIHSSSCHPANDLTVSRTQARQLLKNFSGSIISLRESLHWNCLKFFDTFFEKGIRMFEYALGIDGFELASFLNITIDYKINRINRNHNCLSLEKEVCKKYEQSII